MNDLDRVSLSLPALLCSFRCYTPSVIESENTVSFSRILLNAKIRKSTSENVCEKIAKFGRISFLIFTCFFLSLPFLKKSCGFPLISKNLNLNTNLYLIVFFVLLSMTVHQGRELGATDSERRAFTVGGAHEDRL